jgi:hypothetical protein
MILYRLNNPGTGMDQANFVQLDDSLCCGSANVICMDSLTLSALGTITSITVKNRLGVNVTTTVSGITNKATLRNAIITAIQAAGGYLNGGGLKVNNPTGTVYNITGIGEVQLVSLENGATRTFTHACTSAYECAVTFFLPYSVGQVALWNNTSVSLGTVASGTSTASIETILDTLTSEVNTVTANVGRGGFDVSVQIPSTATYFIAGAGPESRNCFPQFA